MKLAVILFAILLLAGCSSPKQAESGPTRQVRPVLPPAQSNPPAPYIPQPFTPGFRECGTTTIRAQGLYKLENCYILTPEKTVAGGVRLDDPKQGIIIVATPDAQKEFKTPVTAGEVRLMSIEGAIVTFSVAASKTQKFDLTTETFVR